MTEIKKILIDDGANIEADFFVQDFICNGVEEVWIEKDFDIDFDAAVGLGCIKSLERFKIIDPSSPFFVEGGLLYINIGEITNLCFDDIFPDYSQAQGLNRRNSMVWRSFFDANLVGKVLVAIPPAYPDNDIVIPEGVVGICKGAILNCHIDSLTLPQSLKEVAVFAIVNSTIKEIKVPNWKSFNQSGCVSGNSTIEIIRSNIEGETLSEQVVDFWRDNIDTSD